jgi:hypothetical protein
MAAAKQTKNAIQTNNIKLTRQLPGSPARANEPAAYRSHRPGPQTTAAMSQKDNPAWSKVT